MLSVVNCKSISSCRSFLTSASGLAVSEGLVTELAWDGEGWAGGGRAVAVVGFATIYSCN